MLPPGGLLSTVAGDGSTLAPVAGRAICRKTVTLVAVAALLCGLTPSLLWLRTHHGQLRSHHDAALPLLLEWNAARVRARLDAARGEMDELVRTFPLEGLPTPRLADPGAETTAEAPADPPADRLAPVLSGLLEASGTFSGLLVLAPSGEMLAAVGAGAEIEALVEAIQPKTALQSQLMEAMRSVQLRKELTSAGEAKLRPFALPGLAPMLVAGAALRGPDGTIVASLHGVVSLEALAVELSGGSLVAARSLALVDAEGRTAVLGTASGSLEETEPGLGVLDLLGDWGVRHELSLGRFGWGLVVEEPVMAGIRDVGAALAQALVVSLLLALGFAALAHWRVTGLVRPLWSLYESMRLAAREAPSPEVSLRGAQGEVESLIRVFNVMTRRSVQRREEIERSQKALQVQNEAFQAKHRSLSKLTITDPLTQLANRRFLEDQIAKEIKRLARTQQGLSMLVVDIDDFKKLNDRYGHAAGDEFLKQVAGILREQVRATDLVARFGGEEFVVLATGTDLEGAVTLGEKLRTSVAEASFIVDETKRPRRATISVGVAQYRGSQMDLFNSADAALYEAKSAGKNCVIAADPEQDAS